MSVVQSERVKLTANWLDRGGTACLTIGVIAPGAAAIFGYPVVPAGFGSLLIGVGL